MYGSRRLDMGNSGAGAFRDPDNLAVALEASIHEYPVKATDRSRDVAPLQKARAAVDTDYRRREVTMR